MISAQSIPGNQHISPNWALYCHIRLPKASHCIHCFLFVFGDVGLNGDMGKAGSKFAKIGGEFFTAGQGKTGEDKGTRGSLSCEREKAWISI